MIIQSKIFSGDIRISTLFTNKHILVAIYPLLCIVMISRRMDAVLNPQPWAEDGTVFIHDAFCHSINSIFLSYAGYYTPLPRIVTLISTIISPIYNILIMNLFAILVSALIFNFFLHPLFRSVIKNDLLRLLCVILILSSPNEEVFMNITNLQWFTPLFLFFYCVLILTNLKYFLNSGNILFYSVIILAVVFSISTPLSVLILPLYIVIRYNNLVQQKNGLVISKFKIFFLEFPFLLTLMFFLANTFIAKKITAGAYHFHLEQINGILYQLFYRIVYFNSTSLPNFYLSHYLLIAVILGSFFASIMILKNHNNNSQNIFTLFFFEYLCVFFLSRPKEIEYFSSIGSTGGSRYFFIPYYLLLIILIIYIDNNRKNFRWYLSVGVLFLIAFNFYCNYWLPPYIDHQYIQVVSSHIYGNLRDPIPINPGDWNMTLDCY